MHYFCKKVTKEHSPGAHKSWWRINRLCKVSHLKTRFKKHLDQQNMLENALSFRKN